MNANSLPSQVNDEIHAPEISERHVWNCLKHLKKTATGTDLIPFWVWRDHAEIFTPIISKIWNLSLKSKYLAFFLEESPLPKVDVPKVKSDYRGISIHVTPVVACAFEKSIYNTHARDTVEQNLSSTQFAYKTGGSCTDALVSMQHAIYSYLDNPNCTM